MQRKLTINIIGLIIVNAVASDGIGPRSIAATIDEKDVGGDFSSELIEVS
jgi:hypothetical protein